MRSRSIGFLRPGDPGRNPAIAPPKTQGRGMALQVKRLAPPPGSSHFHTTWITLVDPDVLNGTPAMITTRLRLRRGGGEAPSACPCQHLLEIVTSRCGPRARPTAGPTGARLVACGHHQGRPTAARARSAAPSEPVEVNSRDGVDRNRAATVMRGAVRQSVGGGRLGWRLA